MDNSEKKTPAELAEDYAKALEQETLELARFRKALEEEFAGRSLGDTETASLAKGHVVDLVPDAATQLKWLIMHADSEAVRKDISKWVIELAMRTATGDDTDKGLQELLNSFRKAPVPTIDDS